MTFSIPTEADTKRLGALMARYMARGDILCLEGDLGAGKTTFARALIQALIGADCVVPSPTFTLVQVYDAPDYQVWHFDLYRLQHAEEIYELGYEMALGEVSLIEWPERLGALYPSQGWRLHFQEDHTLKITVPSKDHKRLELVEQEWVRHAV